MSGLRSSGYVLAGSLLVFLLVFGMLWSGTAYQPAGSRQIRVNDDPPPPVVYLPLVLRGGALPDVPTLDEIDNSDGDGSYTLHWSPSALAVNYTVEEDDALDFSSPTVVYFGPDTSKAIAGKDPGDYYYRVRAENGVGFSGWSDVKMAAVTQQSPLVCETHTFGSVGHSLQIPTTGTWEHFTAENTMLVETLEVKSMLKATFPTTVYVAAGINGVRLEDVSHYVVGNVWTPYYLNRISLASPLQAGDDIYYYAARTGDSTAYLGWGNYVKLCGR